MKTVVEITPAEHAQICAALRTISSMHKSVIGQTAVGSVGVYHADMVAMTDALLLRIAEAKTIIVKD